MSRAGNRPDASRGHRSEILVSSLLKGATESAGDIAFREGREVELRGQPRLVRYGWGLT